ncbi:MAG: hypothetical protein MUE85_22365 [Microscillaceae bacterium]|jgi:hypothetical protein|nr:hypothetical protein [Microscillaceae bacterium]
MKKQIKALAKKYTLSESTVETLLNGLMQTGGNQVQFNIPELGGMGQWQNGMTMIGDMFNNFLKNQVNNLCFELAEIVKTTPVKQASNADNFTFKGSQNSTNYTYYAEKNLLVIEIKGKTKKYDTGSFVLSGVQQQQSEANQDLKFQTTAGKQVSLKDFKSIK